MDVSNEHEETGASQQRDAETPTARTAPASEQAAGATVAPSDAAEAEAAAAEDAATRKRRRSRRQRAEGESNRTRTWVIIIVAVLAVGLLGGLSYWAYDTIAQRRLAAERLERATQLVEDADVVVIEVDEIVRTPIESSVGERADSALVLIPGARGDLEEAESLIALAKPVLRDEDVAAAEALTGSASARLDMLEHGELILEANSQAAEAIDHALAGWDLILEAETLSDDAVKEYNKLTDDAVAQSKKLASDAKTRAEEAKTEFESAAAALPGADFTPYIEYAEAKAAALAVSIKADDAFLEDRPTDANTLNDQYNDAEKTLIALAKTLPASPVEPIKTAYEALAAEPTEEYFEARDRATASDALLRSDETTSEEP